MVKKLYALKVEKKIQNNEQIKKVLPILLTNVISQKRQQLLKINVEEVVVSTVIFIALLRSAVIAAFICGGMVKFEIQTTTILGWLNSAVGIICGLSLVARNNYDFFIKPRIIGSSKRASSQRIHEEGRTI